jgi:hypothetical protein
MHLELVRIGGGADGVMIDRVQFGPCPDGPGGTGGYVGCGSGQVFFTNCSNPACAKPKDVTIRNSLFMGSVVNYHMQASSVLGTTDQNFLFAYNTFGTSEPIAQGSNIAGVKWTGNYGERPQLCTTGSTWTKNVWAAASGTACGTDLRVASLALDGDLKPTGGSAAINGGEATCAVSSGGVDFAGTVRPTSTACDAGAWEVG